MGGMGLHQGKIAEMRTGEGKTLTSTLPVYLNALTGKGVHIVTVNDYLASRDAETMRPLYNFLGLSVGVSLPQAAARRKAAGLPGRYHLRHQQRIRLRLPARQHGATTQATGCSAALNFAIVDEVDSILIDEARTPLIISGQADDNTSLYLAINQVAPQLHPPRRRGRPAHWRGRDQAW